MSLKACGDTIVVELIHEEKIGLIHVPDQAQKQGGATVISVGPDCPHDLKPGERIRFQGNEGLEIESQGKKYRSLKPKWIIAKEE